MNGHIAIEDCGLDVCHLEGTAQTDGRGLVCLYLARELSKCGYYVDLLTRGPRNIHRHWAPYVNVREVGAGAYPTTAENGAEYQFVLVNHWSVVDRLGHCPVVYQPHEIELLRKTRMVQGFEEAIDAQTRLFNVSRAVVVPSNEIRNYVVENLGVPVQRTILMSPGIDSLLFSPRDRRAARAKAGLDLAVRLVLFVGRIEARKGLDVLARVFDQLPGDVHLAIIGEAKPDVDSQDLEVLDKLRVWRDSREYQSRVHMIGAVPWFELPDYYCAADVVVLPSRMEPFGLPTLEALSCGVPVVGSDIDGFRDLIRHEVDGLLCPVGDVSAFTEAVLSVLTDSSWHANESVQKRAETASAHDWSNSLSALVGHLFEESTSR